MLEIDQMVSRQLGSMQVVDCEKHDGAEEYIAEAQERRGLWQRLYFVKRNLRDDHGIFEAVVLHSGTQPLGRLTCEDSDYVTYLIEKESDRVGEPVVMVVEAEWNNWSSAHVKAVGFCRKQAARAYAGYFK